MTNSDRTEFYKKFKPVLISEISRILDEFQYSEGVIVEIDLSKETIPRITYSVKNKYAFTDMKKARAGNENFN